jgi:O-antigen ligase
MVAGGYAYGILVAAVYGFLFARLVDGRLALVGGTFGDPNGFALSILIGAPFLWLKAAFANSFQKLFFFACSAVVFISFAKAGSRGGLLALSAMLVVMFMISNMKQRVMICVLAVIAVAAAATLLPGYLRARYLTIFSPASSSANLDESSRGQLESDIESSGERRALLEQSIHMTFEHPIFGVGPGVFAFAAWDERKAQSGSGGPTLVTHNTYTQISSECGIPGFIFFIGAVFLSLKYTVTDFVYFRRSQSDIAKLARSLLLAFSALLVGIFFLSTAYSHFIALFLALAAALHNIATQAGNRVVPASVSPALSTRAGFGVPKLQPQQRPERKPVRDRVPSYLRPRGIAPATAVQDPPDNS